MTERRAAASGAQSAPDADTGSDLATEAPPAVTQCERCEKWDADLKWHYGAVTMHHDCATPRERREVLGDGSVHSVTDAATLAAFEGSEQGLRGPELRAHVASAHLREAPKAEAARAASEAAAQAEQEGR